VTAHRLEWDDGGGTRGSVELEVPATGGRARYEAVLAGPGLGKGLIVVRDGDVRTLTIR